MTVDDASGTVIICQGGGMFLLAKSAGLLVRNVPFGRARWIAWTEISHFADGRWTDGKDQGWRLLIILRTGKQVPVGCSSILYTPSEVAAAVRQAAQAHGIPADLAGVATKDGRPAIRSLYRDPGGQAGLRYWDGRQWSPLLPPEVGEWTSRTVQNGPSSWSALPMTEGRWTYAATKATYYTVWFAAFAATSAALLTGGLLTPLWWDRDPHHGHASSTGFWVSGGLAVMFAFVSWRNRRLFRKLDEAAKGAPGSWA